MGAALPWLYRIGRARWAGFYAYNWYELLPTYQKEYEDVAIGMNRDEVRYVKGYPFSGYYPALEQKLINEGKNKLDVWLGSVVET